MDIWDYTYTWSDFIGNIGVVLLIATYAGLQFEKLDAKGFWYSFNNLLVAILLGINLYYKPNISSIIIEIFWLGISAYGLYRWYKNRKKNIMLWTKVKEFWIRSYTSDRRAFYYETIASAAVFISMTWISVTAAHPPMHLIYPVSFTGAVFSIAAFIRRGAGWPLVMTTYFAFLHVFGFGRAMGWY